MADDAQQEEYQHQRADRAGRQLYRIHGFQPHRRRQHRYRAENKRQTGTERRAKIGGPERRGDGHIRRQVARIIRNIRGEGDLPQRRQRYGGQPAREGKAAAG